MPISILAIFTISNYRKKIMPYHPTTSCLDRFPETEYEPEILYKLYLIFKDSDPTKSEAYASHLKDKTSEFYLCQNPDQS